MNPYSHLVIASQLEKDIMPTLPNEYYWGAVVPDIRHICGLHRSQTHLSPELLVGLTGRHPQLKSFIQGYLIHCLTDLVELKLLLQQQILLRPLLHLWPQKLLVILIEAFFIESMPLQKQISGQPNQILRDMGVTDEKSGQFDQIMRTFLAQPSLEAEMGFVKAYGTNLRLEMYTEAIRKIQKSTFLKSILFTLANPDKLNQQVLSQIRQAETFKKIRE